MKTVITLLLLLVLKVDQEKYDNTPLWSVKFSIDNAGFEVGGTLNVIEAEIKFDPEDLRHSYIHASADPSSIQTGISIRDKHLKRSDYFDVVNFPEIRIQSKSFKKNGAQTYTGKFDLTIKGITKEIEIPFTIKKNRGIYYEASFEINRLDFNIGDTSITLDEKVKISISVQAS